MFVVDKVNILNKIKVEDYSCSGDELEYIMNRQKN
jgi:hypothetical protein